VYGETSCAVGEAHFGHTSPSVVTLSGCSPDVEAQPDWLLWTGQQGLLSSRSKSMKHFSQNEVIMNDWHKK